MGFNNGLLICFQTGTCVKNTTVNSQQYTYAFKSSTKPIIVLGSVSGISSANLNDGHTNTNFGVHVKRDSTYYTDSYFAVSIGRWFLILLVQIEHTGHGY